MTAACRPKAVRGARSRLIDAARDVLIRDGEVAVNVSEVARIAGINRSTAYKYFGGRDDLVHAVISEIGVEMRDYIKASGLGGVREDGADFAARSHALQFFIMRNRELCRAWVIKALISGRGAEDSLCRQIIELETSLIGDEAKLQGFDPEVLAVICLAAIFIWPLWNDTENSNKASREKLAERFTKEFTRLTLFGALNPERFPALQNYLGDKTALSSTKIKRRSVRPGHATEELNDS